MDKVDKLDVETAFQVASLPVMDAIPVLEKYRMEVAAMVVESCARTAYDWCRSRGLNPEEVYSEIRRVHMQVA